MNQPSKWNRGWGLIRRLWRTPRARALTRLLVALVALCCAAAAAALFISHFVLHGQQPFSWLQASAEYKQMRKVTRNNYSHFVRDLVFRSIVRDWPARPVRLEQWMVAKEPAFFRTLERAGNVTFEIVREPSALFEWKKCLDVCGAYFEKNCSAPINLGDSFRRDVDTTTVTPASATTQVSRRRRIVWLSRGKDDSRRAIVNELDVFDALAASTCCSGGGDDEIEIESFNLSSTSGVDSFSAIEFLQIDASKLEGPPLTKQAEMFSDVDILISLHGAGLSNMLFMPFGSFVVEIMPGAYDKPTYRGLASCLGHRYYRLHTATAAPSLFTRMKYAFDSAADRDRKFRRDAQTRMQANETQELAQVILDEVQLKKRAN
mmetsp:Transcript_21614/g.53593  ORF Transcript_21614/g.53593 Transcript_21614/m.53593 type:complete len:376 (-) Transcript_21614:80-1207(-)|eukprot:CAMPEP_0197608702 /NCGR_PEP_ID=MMETSP1326-20131121/49675_1 /TAXON_ID=1155430 /ORGANISM="Genus nov. species nov., Strain RCC2288" /LENGTH=375 /DNA_ID=CAMNT_0043176961 /DNA_START=123 /DNA_END=1250 /DNA_ORIENTATION=-